MELDGRQLPGLADLIGEADRGHARAIRRGPSTVAEVLERARQGMDAQDEAERYAADPIAWIRAHRPRNLLARLLGR